MQIRDRIIDFRRVPARELLPHPRNWRKHPPAQQDALRGVLAEIGYAGALLARPTPQGLQLIDGHLRAETTPDMPVPVLVVDLTEAEAAKLLAVHDPLAAMAETDQDVLSELLAEVETDSAAVRALLDQLAGESVALPEPDAPELDLPTLHQVVVECRDEAEQEALYRRLTAEGFRCRLLGM